MAEDMMAGFVTSLLCQKGNFLRRELNSHTISTRYQLCRILSGVSLKRRAEGVEISDVETKRPRYSEVRFNGTCHNCGIIGHKAVDCRKRKQESSSIPRLPDKTRGPVEKMQPIVCYVCDNLDIRLIRVRSATIVAT